MYNNYIINAVAKAKNLTAKQVITILIHAAPEQREQIVITAIGRVAFENLLRKES